MAEQQQTAKRRPRASAEAGTAGVTDREQTANRTGVSEDIDSEVFEEMGQWVADPGGN